MGLHKEDADDNQGIYDFNFDEDIDDLSRKKQVKRMLEERLERKRLKQELEDYEGELDGEFDWDQK